VIVQDTTGFIVNRLLTPYMLSAIRLLEMGTGTIADIDHAMKSGAAHPMGPFELADYIGLDVVEAMTMNIYQDMHQPHVVAAAHPDSSGATGLSGPQERQGLLRLFGQAADRESATAASGRLIIHPLSIVERELAEGAFYIGQYRALCSNRFPIASKKHGQSDPLRPSFPVSRHHPRILDNSEVLGSRRDTGDLKHHG
jgi:3-hydroxyacyl-CoA dehydrogenase